MNKDFRLSETALLGCTLDELRCSVAYKGHPLSVSVLARKIGMSPNTYRKIISGDAVMQVITCEC